MKLLKLLHEYDIKEYLTDNLENLSAKGKSFISGKHEHLITLNYNGNMVAFLYANLFNYHSRLIVIDNNNIIINDKNIGTVFHPNINYIHALVEQHKFNRNNWVTPSGNFKPLSVQFNNVASYIQKLKVNKFTENVVQFNDGQIQYIKQQWDRLDNNHRNNRMTNLYNKALTNKKLSKTEWEHFGYLLKNGRTKYEDGLLSTKN